MAECPRGSVVAESEHVVKTLDKAKDWFPHCSEIHLPIRVVQQKAENGRIRVQIFTRSGNLIYTRG